MKLNQQDGGTKRMRTGKEKNSNNDHLDRTGTEEVDVKERIKTYNDNNNDQVIPNNNLDNSSNTASSSGSPAPKCPKASESVIHDSSDDSGEIFFKNKKNIEERRTIDNSDPHTTVENSGSDKEQEAETTVNTQSQATPKDNTIVKDDKDTVGKDTKDVEVIED